MPQQLIDTLQKVTKNYMEGTGMTDLVIGTVTKLVESPFDIEITIEGTMLPLPKAVLRFTESVIPKQLILGGHSHQYTDDSSSGTSTKTTSPAMENITGMENGIALPGGGTAQVTINRGLILGDKVLLLRVLNGQNFIILSRVYAL